MTPKFKLGDSVYYNGLEATVVNVVTSRRRPPWVKKSALVPDYKYAVTTEKGEYVPLVPQEKLSSADG